MYRFCVAFTLLVKYVTEIISANRSFVSNPLSLPVAAVVRVSSQLFFCASEESEKSNSGGEKTYNYTSLTKTDRTHVLKFTKMFYSSLILQQCDIGQKWLWNHWQKSISVT